MTGPKFFYDTNVLIYLLEEEHPKKVKILDQMNYNAYISTQIISENINVCYKKLKIEQQRIREHIENLLIGFNLVQISLADIHQAITLKEKYKFSFWDSLIISSALNCDCAILYSEDLQHNQLIESRLRIVNPFI